MADRILCSNTSAAEAIREQCDQHNIEIITPENEHFGDLLQETYTPPLLLFRRGIPRIASKCVAVIGTRRCSPYGRRIAREMSAKLAQCGYTIVSGLAYGIDAAAHEGALESGGNTLAVLGSGLLQIYPREHQELADRISGQGALLSEFAPNVGPNKTHFPQRNRIISGLSSATIVIQAAERSGALITANLALEQGREVFAIPGPVNDYRSRGCHQLIRDGAYLAESADDILSVMENAPVSQIMRGDAKEQTVTHELSNSELLVYSLVEESSTSVDYLIQSSELVVSEVLQTLTQLELKRLIVRDSTQYVSRA
ncbi:MAG: DNA-processing protein DprA [Pirellulales bacterium]|nr:DNA-processing protein DprA [Pirellulales bacterium]